MILENELIPYQCLDLPSGPWLVFAPHPDDESFGMGGSLLLAAKQGVDIYLVFMTDGAQGGILNAQELVTVRHNEAEAAGKILHAREIFFWDEADRKLPFNTALVNKIATLTSEINPQSVFFPSPMELHPDHRTTAQLVWAGLQRADTFHGKAYAYDISVQGQINYLVDISSVVDEKHQLMSVYASQLGENNYLEVIQALDRARSYTLGNSVLAAEGFYLFPSIQGELTTHTLSVLQPYWKTASKLSINEPLVSIVIRTKDRPELLKQALVSIAKQSYGNIELIIINDAGANITDISRSYKPMISKIKVYDFAESVGRSAAANKGLELARGEYIGFLDDDDWLGAEHIRLLVDKLQDAANNILIAAYASTHCIDTERNKVLRTYAQDFDPVLLKIENYIPLHALLFRRKAIVTDPKCSFDVSLDLYEDWDFWLQLLKRGDFVHVNKVTAFYRIGSGSGEGVNAEQERSMQALEKIARKWFKRWTANDYMKFIGRARFLQNQTIELEKLRHEKEQQCLILESWGNDFRQNNLQYEAKLQHYEAKLQQHEEKLQQREQELSQEKHNRERIAENYEAEIKRLSQSFEKQLKQVSVNYEQEIQRQSENYNTILSSSSWKMTRPLRFLRRRFSLTTENNRLYKQGLWKMAKALYCSPLLQPFIRKIPFDTKQRIRSFLVKNQITETVPSKFNKQEQRGKVSIIIPVYNHAEYLQQCIDSAIAQTWPQLEVIICDDASPDPDVKDILLKYVDNPRCKVMFSEQNEGISNTQNKLLAAASGEIIAFLDCDDYLNPDAVERCMQRWQDDTVYLHTGRVNIDAKGKEVNRISFELLPREDYFAENLERMFATHFKLIHRHAIARVGAFDTRFDSAQDYDMLMRVAFHYPTNAFVHLPEFLYFHRLHEKQTTAAMNKKQLDNTHTIQAEARLRKAIQQGQFKHFISIIMLSYGKKEQTLSAIKSLEDTIKIPHEIILFDNGSAEETVNFIKAEIDGKFKHVKVIYNESNLGSSAGRRAALKYASGEWFIIFDNDEIAEPGWIEELLVRTETDENIAAVCCKVIFPDDSLQFSGGYLTHLDDQLVELDLYDKGKNTYDLSTAVFRDCDWCPIGATLFTLNPGDFLHEGYPNIFEDAGVSMALKKQGKRLVNSPGSWVWHEHIIYQKKADVDMHDRYLNDRYNPKLMMTSMRSFFKENNLIINDEYIWRENGLNSLSRTDLIKLLENE